MLGTETCRLAVCEREFDNELHAGGGGDRTAGGRLAAGGALPRRPRVAVDGAGSARRLDPSRMAGEDVQEAGGRKALPAAGVRPFARTARPMRGVRNDRHLLWQSGPVVDQTRDPGTAKQLM